MKTPQTPPSWTTGVWNGVAVVHPHQDRRKPAPERRCPEDGSELEVLDEVRPGRVWVACCALCGNEFYLESGRAPQPLEA